MNSYIENGLSIFKYCKYIHSTYIHDTSVSHIHAAAIGEPQNVIITHFETVRCTMWVVGYTVNDIH